LREQPIDARVMGRIAATGKEPGSGGCTFDATRNRLDHESGGVEKVFRKAGGSGVGLLRREVRA
jgi:hypothetical protein